MFLGEGGHSSEAEMYEELAKEPMWVQVMSHRITSLLIVSLISLKFIFKTHLEELRGASYFFLVVVFILIFMLMLELIAD